MSAQHTPGPWIAGHNDFWHKRESNYGQHFVATPRVNSTAYDSQYDRQIAWLSKSPFEGGSAQHQAHDAEMEANARLIAAAPELLEALEAVRFNNRNDVTGQRARLAWAKANAAIAKARGAA